MLKKLLAITFILSLFSCVIEIDEESNYVGTWERSTGATTSISLVITENTYSVREVITSSVTGLSTTTEIERGSLTNPTSEYFTLTKTYTYEAGQLVYVPISYQQPSTVSWSVSSTRLILVDNVNTYTNGTFYKR